MEEKREWYALYVREGSEEDVVLRVRGLDGAAAMTPVERRVTRAGRTLRRALMPGYVFARCAMTPAMWQALRHTKSVLRILGEPYEPIPAEQMAVVFALWRHGIDGTLAERRGGVTRIAGGPLLAAPHAVTRASPRDGWIAVRLELPGGPRELTLSAAFV